MWKGVIGVEVVVETGLVLPLVRLVEVLVVLQCVGEEEEEEEEEEERSGEGVEAPTGEEEEDGGRAEEEGGEVLVEGEGRMGRE